MHRAPFNADGRRGHAEGVEDRFLCRLRAGLEEGSHGVVRDHAARGDAARFLFRARETAVAGGKGKEDVTGAVGSDAADTRQTNGGPLRQAVALVR